MFFSLPQWFTDPKTWHELHAPIGIRWALRDEEQNARNAAREKSWALRFKLVNA